MNNKDIIQKLNLENLLIISKILRKERVFIFYGTLLGVVREKIFKKGMMILMLIDIKSKKKILKILKKLKIFR